MVFTAADLIALLPMLQSAAGAVGTLIQNLQNEGRDQATPEETAEVMGALVKVGADRARFDAAPNPHS
jgi:hypothetical protein